MLLSTHVFAAGNYEETLKTLAEGVIAESVKAKKERLAIIDFTDVKGAVTTIGQFLAEELGTQLLVAGDVKVVERNLVSSTLKKRHISQLDSAPPKVLKGVAKTIRTDVFAIGSYIDSPDGILVTAGGEEGHTAASIFEMFMPKGGTGTGGEASTLNPVPTAWFQSINALAIFILAPFFAWLWLVWRISTPLKMVLGIFLMGCSFFVMAAASRSYW